MKLTGLKLRTETEANRIDSACAINGSLKPYEHFTVFHLPYVVSHLSVRNAHFKIEGNAKGSQPTYFNPPPQIGRASCRERV